MKVRFELINLKWYKIDTIVRIMNILILIFLQISMILLLIWQSSVSLKRLSKFLQKDELDPNNVKSLPEEPGTPAVRFSDATLSWGKDEPVCLKNVSFNIKDRELVAVVGQVGSGKSSLVAAMLGLMEKLSGEVGVKGRVAYVPQVGKTWKEELKCERTRSSYSSVYVQMILFDFSNWFDLHINFVSNSYR